MNKVLKHVACGCRYNLVFALCDWTLVMPACPLLRIYSGARTYVLLSVPVSFLQVFETFVLLLGHVRQQSNLRDLWLKNFRRVLETQLYFLKLLNGQLLHCRGILWLYGITDIREITQVDSFWRSRSVEVWALCWVERGYLRLMEILTGKTTFL